MSAFATASPDHLALLLTLLADFFCPFVAVPNLKPAPPEAPEYFTNTEWFYLSNPIHNHCLQAGNGKPSGLF